MSSANYKYACSIENETIKVIRVAPFTLTDESLEIQFMRTIRAPYNAGATKLPLDLGKFPLQGEESMSISFQSRAPFMVKVYVGSVNAVSGEHRLEGAGTQAPHRRYHQSSLDGIAVSPGVFRQFEALLPSSSGPQDGGEYSAEVVMARESSCMSDLQFEITPWKKGPEPIILRPRFVEPKEEKHDGRRNGMDLPETPPFPHVEGHECPLQTRLFRKRSY
ncbi:hypothetical protein PG994_008890 [Apiospora phragmitis]|uniref:Uncharacterized protein n=1 Tax=Apiospora phragmitis TaxID=2905665 RepID=A0ABR1UHR6_9PEZI